VQISARRREKVTIFDLRRRRFRKLATAPALRFAGNTGEPDAPGRGKSQRGTLHRQFRCRFPGGALKASRNLGVRFILFGLSTPARKVLQLSRLIKVFEIYETEDQAAAP